MPSSNRKSIHVLRVMSYSYFVFIFVSASVYCELLSLRCCFPPIHRCWYQMGWSIANGGLLQLLFYLWTVYYIPDNFGLQLFSTVILAQMSEKPNIAWPQPYVGLAQFYITYHQNFLDAIRACIYTSTTMIHDMYIIALVQFNSSDRAPVSRVLTLPYSILLILTF